MAVRAWNNQKFAVRRGNSMLLSVLNKIIKTMSASKFSNAVYMYDSNLKKVTVKEFIRDNFWSFMVLVVSVFLIVLILMITPKSQNCREKGKRGTAAGRKGEQCKDRFFETYEPRYPDIDQWNSWYAEYRRSFP